VQGEAALAALMALRDFDPTRLVPRKAYLIMRVMGGAIARYRKEWSYGLRQAPAEGIESSGQAEADARQRADSARDEMRWAMKSLTDVERTLIERLFWNEETEAQIARSLGVTQQAVSKRKRSILKALQRRLEPTAE
jgi:RNA polymerase sigma factor (sigma-70 family)